MVKLGKAGGELLTLTQASGWIPSLGFRVSAPRHNLLPCPGNRLFLVARIPSGIIELVVLFAGPRSSSNGLPSNCVGSSRVWFAGGHAPFDVGSERKCAWRLLCWP